LGHGLPDGSPQKEGDPDQEGEAGQVLGGAELGPFQLYAEAAALGIPRPMRRSYRATRSARGSGKPGFFLPWGPDPEDPDPDGLVLPEEDPSQVDRLPGVERPVAQEPALVGSGVDLEVGDPANDERRLPLQQKLEPRDPMKATVAQQDRRPAGLPQGMDPQPQERMLPPILRPEYRRLAKGRHLDRDRPRPPAS